MSFLNSEFLDFSKLFWDSPACSFNALHLFFVDRKEQIEKAEEKERLEKEKEENLKKELEKDSSREKAQDEEKADNGKEYDDITHDDVIDNLDDYLKKV